MNRDELRWNIVNVLLANAGTFSAIVVAERILDLLPPTPKLEWRDNELYLGEILVGYVQYAPRATDGFVGYARTNRAYLVCLDPILQSVRNTVESRAKEAINIDQS